MFDCFEKCAIEDVKKKISAALSKLCQLDLLPTKCAQRILAGALATLDTVKLCGPYLGTVMCC